MTVNKKYPSQPGATRQKTKEGRNLYFLNHQKTFMWHAHGEGLHDYLNDHTSNIIKAKYDRKDNKNKGEMRQEAEDFESQYDSLKQSPQKIRTFQVQATSC